MGLTDIFQPGLVDADGRVEAVDVAWPIFELIGNRIKLRLAVNRQIGGLELLLAIFLPQRATLSPFIHLSESPGLALVHHPTHQPTLSNAVDPFHLTPCMPSGHN